MSIDRETVKSQRNDLHRLLRQKWKRYNDLWGMSYKLGYHTLEEPIRKGWVRKFALSEESKNRKDSTVIARVLDIINTNSYCKDRKWSELKYQPEYANDARIDNQSLKSLTQKEYDKLGVREKKYFIERTLYRTFGKGNEKRWVIEKPGKFFRLKDSRHYITKIPIFDPAIDRERAEIWNWITSNGLYSKIAKIHGWQVTWWDDNDKARVMDKALKKEMREYVDEMIGNKYLSLHGF